MITTEFDPPHVLSHESCQSLELRIEPVRLDGHHLSIGLACVEDAQTQFAKGINSMSLFTVSLGASKRF